MCILISSTEHPDYPFILLSNRDEYFRRPTGQACFREVNNKTILSPVDLGRPEHGTWIGVDKEGRLAALVNFREEDDLNAISEISRGILPIDYLSSDLDEEEWYKNLEYSLAKRIESKQKDDKVPLRRIGGFSLLYGTLQLDENHRIKKLNIISNRGDKGSVFESQNSSDQTIGLSNSLFHNPWSKVEMGKSLLREAIKDSVQKGYDKEMFVEELFKVLSTDTFDRSLDDKPMTEKIKGLKSTIFVPPLETKIESSNHSVGKYYGTRTQTIILLDKSGKLEYFERNLNDSDEIKSSEPRTQYFTLDIAPSNGE